MKLTGWQFVAALAVLMTGVILSHVYAPGAVSMITSIATTLFAIFIQKGDAPALPPAGDK